jgi:hypothetical protein
MMLNSQPPIILRNNRSANSGCTSDGNSQFSATDTVAKVPNIQAIVMARRTGAVSSWAVSRKVCFKAAKQLLVS